MNYTKKKRYHNISKLSKNNKITVKVLVFEGGSAYSMVPTTLAQMLVMSLLIYHSILHSDVKWITSTSRNHDSHNTASYMVRFVCYNLKLHSLTSRKKMSNMSLHVSDGFNDNKPRENILFRSVGVPCVHLNRCFGLKWAISFSSISFTVIYIQLWGTLRQQKNKT